MSEFGGEEYLAGVDAGLRKRLAGDPNRRIQTLRAIRYMLGEELEGELPNGDNAHIPLALSIAQLIMKERNNG